MNLPMPRDADQQMKGVPDKKPEAQKEAADVWRPLKPGIEINQRGQLRTTSKPPGA